MDAQALTEMHAQLVQDGYRGDFEALKNILRLTEFDAKVRYIQAIEAQKRRLAPLLADLLTIGRCRLEPGLACGDYDKWMICFDGSKAREREANGKALRLRSVLIRPQADMLQVTCVAYNGKERVVYLKPCKNR